MTTVSISQPGYLPYLGFFDKMIHSDIFVYLDDVQYEIRAFHNRNRIRTSTGTTWLTVPLSHPFGKKINEIRISNSVNWQESHKGKIRTSYLKTPFFEKFWPEICSIFDKKWELLVDLNLEFIQYFAKVLNIKTKTIRSSELDVSSNRSEKLVEICKKLGASTYLSGMMGKEYLDEKIFAGEGISVDFQNFKHPVYKQIHGDFIPNLSVIDVIFNEVHKSINILK